MVLAVDAAGRYETANDGGHKRRDGTDERGPSGAILAAVAVGYLVSRDTRIVEVNEMLCRTLGFEREELLDLEMPWPFTPPEGRDVSYAMAPRMTAEALASGYSQPSSCR